MFEYKSIQDTVVIQDSDERQGLGAEEAKRRLYKNGANRLQEPPPKSFFSAFLEQLNDPLIYVLLAAAAISLFLHEVSDAVIIIVVVLLNAVVGLIQEGKAKRALDSLKKLTSPKAYVIRDGREQEISAENLVVGDVICLETGSQVPADVRLLKTHSLKIEESALTGEALAQEKDADFLPSFGKGKDAGILPSGAKEKKAGVLPSGGSRQGRELPLGDRKKQRRELPLGDRKNMAYMSTLVTYGRGKGMVTAVGMDTEIGKIAALINESQNELTPLQRRLGELGKMLSLLSLGLCVLLFLIAMVQDRNILEMLITAISLAVAAVPEGLPAVVTICLALSVTRMVKVNTIIRRLPSVETLGAVSVVCSDKTGTLTQNKMTVTLCFMNGKIRGLNQLDTEVWGELFRGMVLCNDAVLELNSRIGDPTELALLDMAENYGIHRQELEKQLPRRKELSFDSERKMMSTWHVNVQGAVTYTKGAPDEILKRCTAIFMDGNVIPLTAILREQIKKAQEEMAAKALRTLALAKREGDSGPVEQRMIFIGMVGMKDPARPEAAEAVEKFKGAGVETVMITGDHVDTAYAIANQLGIVVEPRQCMTGEELEQMSKEAFQERLKEVRVFARVSPEHKVKIVKGFKESGHIVAMTGDGVNDAPSLKVADVGIAMGMSGTDVARQASDIILTDDNFATIERAMEEGRGVYENIKKSVIFLLSSNLGEIMTMFTAVLLGFASPLKSSHILWINLITDSLPALALGVDKNDGDSLMQQLPRKQKESLFAGGGLACTCFYGILIAFISLLAFLTVPYGLLHSMGAEINLAHIIVVLRNQEILRQAQTYAFTVLGMSQLFHAVGMRNIRKSVFVMNHRENKWMIAACIIGFLLQLLVTKHPFLIEAFGTVHLAPKEWLMLSVLAAFPLLAHEIMVLLYFRSKE